MKKIVDHQQRAEYRTLLAQKKHGFITDSIVMIVILLFTIAVLIYQIPRPLPLVATPDKVPLHDASEVSTPLLTEQGATAPEDTYPEEPEICTQTFDKDNVRFNYPCDWTVRPSDSIENWTSISPPDLNYDIGFIYPADNFTTYESANQEILNAERMTIIESSMTLGGVAYPAKEYQQHGERLILVEIGQKYVGISSERYFEQDVQEGLDIVFNSLELK